MTRPYLHCAWFIASAFVQLVTEAAAQGAPSVPLLSHRAVYTLALDPQKPSGTLAAADGKLEYALEQTSCSWFRAVTTIALTLRANDGRRVSMTSITDVNEKAGGSEMQFKTRRLNDGRQTQASEGTARRVGGRIAVRVRTPQVREFELADDFQFPVQLLATVIESAAAGRPQIAARFYDGAEDGTRAFRVTAQVGAGTTRAVPPDPTRYPAWPVAMGYFIDSATPSSFPETELSTVLLQNGVYSDLRLTFREFALKGNMTEFTPLAHGACD